MSNDDATHYGSWRTLDLHAERDEAQCFLANSANEHRHPDAWGYWQQIQVLVAAEIKRRDHEPSVEVV